MILPTKFLNPSVGVLQVSANILRILHATPVVGMEELRVRSVEGLGERARFSFSSALSLLFVLGALDYDSGADAIELTDRGDSAA